MPRPARIPALLLALVTVLATAGCGLFGDSGPQDTVDAYVKAWTGGDDAGAAAQTDSTDAARDLLGAVRAALKPAAITAEVEQVRTAGQRSSASVNVSWDLGQDRRWSYLTQLDLQPAPDAETGWRIHWAPGVVHPDLQAGQTLALRTTSPDPAPVTDRNGTPLLAPTKVVTILLDRKATGDLDAVASTLARALNPVDREITQQTITDGAARTPDGQAYTVAVLRETDYQGVRQAIYDLPGVRFTSSSRLLAPDADFASQVLPGVRTEVAAQVNGKDGWSVDAVDSTGATQKTLTEQPVTPGTTAQVSLDRTVQAAAEDAADTLPQQVAIVAVQPSTGDILAAAQNSAADRAGAISFTGRYPPGSTFKIVTANAALQNLGVTATTPEPCPGTTSLGGRVVPNEDEFVLGTVPLQQAFARSCNTTFATLASQLAPDALPTAGLQLGFGADYTVPGLTTVTGSVPPADDLVQRAEDGFGQGLVVATPFGMALVAATVAHGAPVVPQLIRDRPTATVTAATQPDAAALAQLRPMMRQVVTDGTATGLRSSGEVYGKTGTAEYSQDGTNRAHGWFVGYRGDLAFAVLVVDGSSSGPAVGVAQRFLAGLRGA
ncbi:penicillin-binding protein [Pseudonocardia kujensis]|uniref:penicillin-binding transpeptidase domain-containing protein n=1 Tax=Pseudonocardia kujensis TaxID=1128675 RepID=UPI001E3150FE|nr:penicillin-binding transpeptidase domain-containing protein [Pseudonocardia kujensis]MCE0765715.1 penicillin-binding protein [Pseudonocardia kujensis]